ncbi:MAG TPA: iron-sulfur cluster assembly scaffold protein [Bryobacteraceae bacterium]|nr:iron-sulfur cluster assembly scaffold protein [Bryobacteraceae bacterium]
MYSERLLDHFRNPRHAGELPLPAVSVEATNPACGDVLRLSVEWVGGRAVSVGYKVRGCTASIAAGSALTELMAGRTRAEIAGIDAGAIEAELGGLPGHSKHAAALCLDAVAALLRVMPS